MEQTLKELAGDLQVIHESLERAEAVERQLGVYWREFEDERDQLRAEVEAASNNARHYADRCTALEAWAWVERTGCSVRPFGTGWAASFVGTVSGHRMYMSSSEPTPLAAVLDAMEKEEKP